MFICKRLKGESKRAYDNLQAYLSLGNTRNMKKTMELTKKSSSNLYRQYKRWNWEKRALEYDYYINSKEFEYENQFNEINTSQLKLSIDFATAIQTVLSHIKQKIDNKLDDINDMQLDEILKLSSNLSKIIPETFKALKLLIDNNTYRKNQKRNIINKVINDKNAFSQSQKLLETISKK